MMIDWLERDGVSLRYSHRAGAGPSLALVHEMGGTLDSWDAVEPRLPDDLAVLRHDTRGAGLSGKIRGTARMDAMTGDLLALLDAAGRPGAAILAGIAVGAAIAVETALRAPDRVGGLVLFAPAVGVPEEARAARLADADLIERDGMAAAVEESLARSYPEHLRGDGARFARLRARWLGNDPSSYAAILRMLVGLDLESRLSALRCPTLVLAGRHDRVRPPDGVKRTAERIPGARFESIESGHFAAVQAPELLAARIAAFVQETGR